MTLRKLIVEIELEGLNVTRFCAQNRISTWFFYDLRRRFAAGGLAAIEPRSRAPHRIANRTSDEVEDAIVAKRKELLDAGLDAGPATIVFHLGMESPSDATIWRVLSRRGFIVADPSKAPKRSVRRFQAERANECWQADDTAWELADGTPVKIINVLDDCTRVQIASRVVPTATAPTIFDALADGALEWGWPERMLWDNAKAHHALTESLAVLGIATRHSRPYHPQTCGKIERFHQTQQRYLTVCDPAATLEQLQADVDAFREIYNHHRPHRALGRRIPASVWHAIPKSGPANHALGTPTEIHRTTVTRTGIVQLGRRYQVIVGRAHTGLAATAITTGTACHIFIAGRLIRALTIDPTRRVQPLSLP